MSKKEKATIEVKGTSITILTRKKDDYTSLTDIAKYKEPDRSDHIIHNWMRNRNTIEFLGIWEQLHNPDFKPLEFERFRNSAGLNEIAIRQMQVLIASSATGQLKE
jgi:hypothetical protein